MNVTTKPHHAHVSSGPAVAASSCLIVQPCRLHQCEAKAAATASMIIPAATPGQFSGLN
jgi:hypothetical protein